MPDLRARVRFTGKFFTLLFMREIDREFLGIKGGLVWIGALGLTAKSIRGYVVAGAGRAVGLTKACRE